MVFFANWGKQLEAVGYAGIEKCQNCKNYCDFWICEHRSVAGVYFIKAKYNKKYLYVCEVCEKAWDIDASAKDEALKRTIGLPTQEQCWEMWDRLMEIADQTAAENKENENALDCVVDALVKAVEELKQTYQEQQVEYIAQRFVAFLQDDDRPA